MNRAFAIIAEFLDRSGPEVLGRALAPPPAELADQLHRFARGTLTPEERYAVCETLFTTPEYLRLLAHQVKDRRERREGAGADSAQ